MASTMTGTVVGYFTSSAHAEAAVSALKAAGFTSNQIGVAISGQDTSANTAAGASTSTTSDVAGSVGSAAHAVGAKTHSAWENFKSFFDSSDVEPYADETTRDTTRSHEITADSDYAHDDVSGSLSGLNVSDEHSRYFGHRLGTSEGQGAVVTVSAAGREDEAIEILEKSGGDVGSNTADYDYSKPVTAEQQKIQLLGEVLRVHKDRVSRGEVRIRKEVITEQQTVQVPVSREELVIERIPVTGQTAVAGTIGADSEIRIPLSEEVASFDKQTVVREEVAIGKRTIENVQEVGGSVSHEELEIENATNQTATTKSV